MKKFFLLILITFFVGGVNAQIKKDTVINTKSVKVDEKTRGADANIITPKPTDDKAIEKSRGPEYGDDYCDININNNTGYTIDIYVDGCYRGTIYAWERKVTWAIPGRTKFYGKSIGGTYTWGPWYFDCRWQYTWSLW